MEKIKFKALPINPEFDPTGGCRMQLTGLETVDESGIFAEVIAAEGMPYEPSMLELAFKAVLKTMVGKIAVDCNARRIGDYLRIYPELRGKIATAYSPYDPENNSCVIMFELLSGLKFEVNKADIQFVNVADVAKVTLERFCSYGSDEPNKLTIGTAFAAYGTNMQFNAGMGDTAKMEWKNGAGEDKTLSIVAIESDYNHMKFAWPTGETVPQADDEVKITIVSRAGIEDNAAQTNSKIVTIVAAA